MARRLRSMFDELRGKRAALITYATGYYPDRDASFEVIRTMFECGADAVEIGLPFSDPVLDGKVIQESSTVALEAGANTSGILGLAKELRAVTQNPIMLMSYYNPVFKYGLGSFAKGAVQAGVDAVIIPDLPIEEMAPWKRECDSAGLETVAFCSVTTDPARIKGAGDMSSGFLYCTSLLGTTGPRDAVSVELPAFIRRVRENTSCPIAVGLGISTPEQCREVGGMADGVIVGSALVQTISGNSKDLKALKRTVREMASSLV
jgi:tryptophan synthase alpha chain